MDARFWTMQILNGVTLGSLLFLVASGFTLIFGLMRIANLTHGALYLLGGYLALAVVRAGGYWPLAGLVGYPGSVVAPSSWPFALSVSALFSSVFEPSVSVPVFLEPSVSCLGSSP